MLAKSQQFGGREMTVFAGLWYINCLSICFVLAAIGRWWLNDEAAIRFLDLLVTLSGWSGAVVPLRTAGSRIWAAPQQIKQRNSVQRFQVYASWSINSQQSLGTLIYETGHDFRNINSVNGMSILWLWTAECCRSLNVLLCWFKCTAYDLANIDILIPNLFWDTVPFPVVTKNNSLIPKYFRCTQACRRLWWQIILHLIPSLRIRNKWDWRMDDVKHFS